MTGAEQERFYIRALIYVFLTGWTCIIILGALRVFHDIGWL